MQGQTSKIRGEGRSMEDRVKGGHFLQKDQFSPWACASDWPLFPTQSFFACASYPSSDPEHQGSQQGSFLTLILHPEPARGSLFHCLCAETHSPHLEGSVNKQTCGNFFSLRPPPPPQQLSLLSPSHPSSLCRL